MGKWDQRFVVKFFFRKGLGSKVIHRKLAAILGSTAYLLTQIKKWDARFKAGDLSCEDKFRPGRPPHVFGKDLSHFLQEFLFPTAGLILE
jgi:hypothetical protein